MESIDTAVMLGGHDMHFPDCARDGEVKPVSGAGPSAFVTSQVCVARATWRMVLHQTPRLFCYQALQRQAVRAVCATGS